MYSLVHSEDGKVHPSSSIEAHSSVVVAPVAELVVEFQGAIEDEEFGVDLKAHLWRDLEKTHLCGENGENGVDVW